MTRIYIILFTLFSISVSPSTYGQVIIDDFAKLTDRELLAYVDSIIFQILDYDSTRGPSVARITSVSHEGAIIESRYAEGYGPNQKPIVVLNGYPLEKTDILKHFKLAETESVSYLKGNEAMRVYGELGRPGIVIVKVDKKKFKKIWRKTVANKVYSAGRQRRNTGRVGKRKNE